jgi:2-C-methyl-D-erythritol 4-phosphate cytidylyltransferase
VAVVLAGGVGQRFGADRPKQLVQLAGRPILERAVRAFVDSPDVDEVLVVVAPEARAEVRSLLDGTGMTGVGLVNAGVLRSDSTRAVLAALGDRDCDVLLHDAARPLVDARIIHDCARALESEAAVTAAVPTTDTVAETVDGHVTSVPDRSRLRNVQTPQGFRLVTIQRAFALHDADEDRVADPSDDCSLVLRYLPEVPIAVVEGSPRNLKITQPHDLALATALLREPD